MSVSERDKVIESEKKNAWFISSQEHAQMK